MRTGSAGGLLALAALAAAACERTQPTYDSFPIPVRVAGGVPTWTVRSPADLPLCGAGGAVDAGAGTLGSMLIDPGTPLTTLEFCPDEVRTRVDLEVVSATDTRITRARFLALPVLNQPALTLGLDQPGAPQLTRVDGVIGADVLKSFAVRFALDPGQPQGPTVQLFPATAGSDSEHALACDSVLPFLLVGGGGVVIDGHLQSVSASRVVISACLEPIAFNGQILAPPGERPPPSGVDLALVLSTSTGPLVLGASAVRRLEAVRGQPVPLAPATLELPSGALPVGVSGTGRLTLVQDDDRNLGPCEELAQARELEATGVCPRSGLCSAAAYVEIERALTLVGAPDEAEVLQSLRTELRPFTREIDGLLGAEALRDVVLDVDYPSQRMIMRCADGRAATCRHRPRYTGSTRAVHLDCLPFASAPVDGGMD